MPSKKLSQTARLITMCSFIALFIFFSGNVCPARGASASPDTYEPDDTFTQAKVIVLNDTEAQHHSFHIEGDKDWVKFYGISGQIYTIDVTNTGTKCNSVIDIYDENGTSLLKTINDTGAEEMESGDFKVLKDSIYFVRISNYDPAVFGDDIDYDLKIYKNFAGTGVITGMITDSVTKLPVDGALVKTTVNATAISVEGYYIMLHPTGVFTVDVKAEGYVPASSSVTFKNDGEVITKDFSLTPTGSTNTTTTTVPGSDTTTTTTIDTATSTTTTISDNQCAVESIYGKDAVETNLLRKYRNTILSQTPQGRTIIKYYYRLSPEVLFLMEESNEFQKKVKAVIDGMVPSIKMQIDLHETHRKCPGR